MLLNTKYTYSLLDTDFYKFLMLQLIVLMGSKPSIYDPFRIKPNRHKVTFKLQNRNSQPLDSKLLINEIRHALNIYANLSFYKEELDFLRRITVQPFYLSQPVTVFKPEFIDWLANYGRRIKDIDIKCNVHKNDLNITVTGPWADTTLFEIAIMSIISEIRNKQLLQQLDIDTQRIIENQGIMRLREKLNFVANERSFRFSDFGTRRRFSQAWHDTVIEETLNHLHGFDASDTYQFSGTSNMYLAMKYNLPCIGTFAHEMPMIFAGLLEHPVFDKCDATLAYSIFLDTWRNLYGDAFGIILTDTFTSKWFFENYNMFTKRTPEQYNNIVPNTIDTIWAGVRQDSGDPIGYAKMFIDYCKKCNVDPSTMTIVFSDSLTFQGAKRILNALRGQVWCAFGIGTSYTNDLGIKPLNIVVKATEISDLKIGLVKLSDVPGKVSGKPKDIAHYQTLFC